jgi:hypothetical protein
MLHIDCVVPYWPVSMGSKLCVRSPSPLSCHHHHRLFLLWLLLLLLSGFSSAAGDVYLELNVFDGGGGGGGGGVQFRTAVSIGHTARYLNLGDGARYVYLVLDFSAPGIFLSADALRRSDSFIAAAAAAAAAGGGYDFISFAHATHFMRVDALVDFEHQAAALSAGASGILGLGPGSPIWDHWRCISVSASHLALKVDPCPSTCGGGGDGVLSCIADGAAGHALLRGGGGGPVPICMSPLSYIQIERRGGRLVNGSAVALLDGGGVFELPIEAVDFVRSALSATIATQPRLGPVIYLGGGGGGGGESFIRLSPDLYIDERGARRRLYVAPVDGGYGGDNALYSLSRRLLLGHRFHLGPGRVCVERIRLRLDSPIAYQCLFCFWTGLLLFWYRVRTRRLMLLFSARRASVPTARALFVELSAVSTMFFFGGHLLIDSPMWRLPLDGGGRWVIYVYFSVFFGIGLLFCLAATLGSFGGGGVFLATPVAIESTIHLALWFTQVDVLHGRWTTFGCAMLFGFFFLHWTRRALFFGLVAWHGNALRRRRRAQIRVLAVLLWLAWPMHAAVLVHYMLAPLLVAYGVPGGDGAAHLAGALFLVHLLYWVADGVRRDELADASAVDE